MYVYIMPTYTIMHAGNAKHFYNAYRYMYNINTEYDIIR